MPIESLEELVRGTIRGKRVGGRPETVEPVLSLLIGLEFAAKVVIRERGVLEVVLAIAASLPHTTHFGQLHDSSVKYINL